MANTEINLTPTATLLEIDSCSPEKDRNRRQAGTENIQSQRKIPCRTWGIASESNIGIVLVHGLGGHSGWFEALARRLATKHIFVLSFDLVGFGKQKDERYFSYHQWLDDTTCVFAYMQSIMADKPIFLLGNSMGALIALACRQLIKPSGLALLSPAFGGHPKIFNFSYQLSELCKTIASPDSQVKLPYGIDAITKDEQVRSWLDKDPGFRSIVPRRMFLDLFFLTQGLCRQKIQLNYPLFMLTAGMDAIVNNQVNELIFPQIISPSKKKTLLSEASHDLALDPAVDQVTDLLTDWMNCAINQNQLAII